MTHLNFDYEKELLRWEKCMLDLRRKYRNTPAGFQDAKTEAAAVRVYEESCTHYRESHLHQLARNYVPTEEPFVGRKKYLTLMGQMLDSRSGLVILYGIGGIGKSALAREFIRQEQDHYDCVLVLSYRRSILDLICDDSQLPITNLQYSCDIYKNKSCYFREKLRILREIAEEKKLLLLLDNVNADKDKNLQAFFSLPCAVLITTRINPAIWDRRGNVGIHVTGLREISEKEAFFRIYNSGNDRITEVQEKLLRSCYEKTEWHPLDMIFKIRENLPSPSEKSSGKAHFFTDLFQCYSISPEEKQILRELCIMPAHGISIALYMQISGATIEHINRLTEYLLIQKVWTSEGEEETLSMHPIIAEAAQKVFHPTLKNCRKLLWGLYDCIYDAWLKTYSENHRAEPCVLALLSAFPRPRGWMMKPLEAMVTFLWIQGYYREARSYVLKLMDDVEKYYGEEHQNTGEMVIRVAAVYYNTMDYETANFWYFKGYEILKTCRHENSAYYHIFSRACEKIARIYSTDGHFKEALMFYDRAYENEVLFEKAGGGRAHYAEHDSAICKTYCQLGKVRVLLDMGKTKEADSLYHQIDMETSGFYRDDFNGNEARTVWVLLLVKEGRYEEAWKHCVDLLERTCKYRGDSSKEALRIREQFADICALRGRRADAVKEYGLVLKRLAAKFPEQREWINRILKKMA